MINEQFRIPLARCALEQSLDLSVAYYQGKNIERADFSRAVTLKVAALVQRPESSFAVYFEEAYPFVVMLFALWHAGKNVWLAANNRPTTAEHLVQAGCCLLGDWPLDRATLLSDVAGSKELSELDWQQTSLTIFTSGSTGQPQAISKALWQLQAEIDALEHLWGVVLARSQVLATVSHQHIYGLLFKVLWPLVHGRVFHSQIYLSPEALLRAMAGKPSCWVSSPAQLNRLDKLTPWAEIGRLKVIFSSGGTLSVDVAQQIAQQSEQQLIDIYGSSETGGIAWRRPGLDARWLPFHGVSIEPLGEQNRLRSVYLPEDVPHFLHDKLELCSDGRFYLLGRNDRLVKIEEKRLSLDAMEQALQTSAWVQQAHCFPHTMDQRIRIAAVIILTAQGLSYLQQQGRSSLVKQLKSQLRQTFESVVLPKKWLFVDRLLVSTQGKIEREKIDSLLALHKQKFPQLQFFSQQDGMVTLSLRMQPELLYFAGHFPGFPILPGVTQLVWAEQYGKLFFPIILPFSRMEVVKFKKIIRPGDMLTLKLEWNADNNKLYFEFSSSTESHSSGRLLFGART